jgi:hypothetical protein
MQTVSSNARSRTSLDPDGRLAPTGRSAGSSDFALDQADSVGVKGRKENALRVHVGDSELVAVLLDFFEHESDCVAIQVGETEIEVSLLGSYNSVAHNSTVDGLLAEFRRQAGGGARSPFSD